MPLVKFGAAMKHHKFFAFLAGAVFAAVTIVPPAHAQMLKAFIYVVVLFWFVCECMF
jgi:hypothetical protein